MEEGGGRGEFSPHVLRKRERRVTGDAGKAVWSADKRFVLSASAIKIVNDMRVLVDDLTTKQNLLSMFNSI